MKTVIDQAGRVRSANIWRMIRRAKKPFSAKLVRRIMRVCGDATEADKTKFSEMFSGR